ncbi:MAG TPA: hypothetical protein VEU08_15985, partial [Vicinamibacterales bacterium]|nr:hypothetical protein [Vicinamibacterales bacterium]
AGGVFISAQQIAIPEPRRGSGDSVTGAYEGWFYNPDGSRSFLVGYYNRNSRQEVDIPIGPNNRIEPGGPDMGQPSHFLIGRQWGMFAVPVPREFKPTDKYVWTLVVNGQSTQIPLHLLADYVMSPFTEIAANNTPPSIRFEQNGKAIQGPIATVAGAPERTAAAGAPLAITVWANDDMRYVGGTGGGPAANRPPVSLHWSKYRGPGAVTFDKANPEVEKLSQSEAGFSGKATVNAKFAEPGDYVLHVTANDYSGDGGGGFGCCWTTGLVKVTVK